MVLQAPQPSILLGTVWLLTWKVILVAVHRSYVLVKRLLVTKLLPTVWFHAGVGFLLVMRYPDVCV